MPTKHSRKLDAAKRARSFRDRNRRFLKLTKHQQKLRIIKDVITHLRTSTIKAETGDFVTVSKNGIEESDNLHEIVEDAKCEVCGVGGLFVSAVLLNNKVKLNQLRIRVPNKSFLVMYDHLSSYLKKWFSIDELRTIEAAFERGRFGGYDADAINFGHKYRNHRARLIAICENMLENDGNFVPADA